MIREENFETMSYKVTGDSCLDLTKEMKQNPHFQMVPLTLQVDDHMVIDDETFDQKAFIKMVKESPNCPKTAWCRRRRRLRILMKEMQRMSMQSSCQVI